MVNRVDGLLEREDPAEEYAAVSPMEATVSVTYDEHFDWARSLTGSGVVRDDAIRQLHGLMVRASRFTLNRMGGVEGLGQARADDIVQSSADDAVVAVLSKLATFEGRARFTTWAYKFAILHTASTVRKERWAHTDVELSSIDEPTTVLGDPLEHAEGSALADALRRGIAEALSPHQRRVLVAVALDGVPIDVVADRLGATRNTVYKTLHDARRKLRAELIEQGYLPHPTGEGVK